MLLEVAAKIRFFLHAFLQGLLHITTRVHFLTGAYEGFPKDVQKG